MHQRHDAQARLRRPAGADSGTSHRTEVYVELRLEYMEFFNITQHQNRETGWRKTSATAYAVWKHLKKMCILPILYDDDRAFKHDVMAEFDGF